MGAGGFREIDVGTDRVIAELAARQDGVVTRRELVAAGVHPRSVDRRIATGRLIAVYRGIFAVGHAGLSERGRIRAALLAAGPHAVASHSTAAYLHRLLSTLPAVIHVTVTGAAPRRRKGIQIHATSRRPPTSQVHGLPATTPLKTLEDLGYPDTLTREALAQRLISPGQLPAATEQRPHPEQFVRRMRGLIRAAGLPQPQTHYRLGGYELDFAWPEHRLAVETDGWGTHGYRAAFERDRARDADLAARGWTVIRITWRQLTREPTRTAATLAAALAHRQAA
jgi:very-short-patch-repair endonuclease